MTAEQQRLDQDLSPNSDWRQWGPYLSERQWGTVREDYSPDGTAWEYFTHETARSRAYRWGEDGLAGFSDCKQKICLSLALWNGRDPLLKERLFGLTNAQGNHGEDVKELYYYLDATPTHSYLKMLYKYPHATFPYTRLREENARRGRLQREFELLDTGIFDGDRYFDVFVEYIKATPEDILMVITAYNRGPDAATLHLAPQIWFRNTWSWIRGAVKPTLSAEGKNVVVLNHPELPDYRLYYDGQPTLLFCENETNEGRLFNVARGKGYFKDGFHDYLVQGNIGAVNPKQTGTKAAGHYTHLVPAGQSFLVRARLARGSTKEPFETFDRIVAQRKQEADNFYASLQIDLADTDARNVHRQALAGMIWNKQLYRYDVSKWLVGDPTQPAPPAKRRHGRNHKWDHLNNANVMSMPDKWEYPWYAAWDLGFHCLPFCLIDPRFAKEQLVLLTSEWYMHPDGQLPAYEWAFGDVNPPVHAWAAWRVFQMDRKQRGDKGDLQFLERIFVKLLLNFTWWVNRKDAQGHNLFQGGFLGLDNIGLFDRSAPLPTGGYLDQADGTSWMAMYSLNMMRIALQLALNNPIYQDLASKFFEHFLRIAQAMTSIGNSRIALWDEKDRFFYSILNLPNGETIPLRVQSIVGLIPLFAVETLEPELLARLPQFANRLEWFLKSRPELCSLVSRWSIAGRGDRRLVALLRGHRMKCVLHRMLDETQFLSPFGIRALSKRHEQQPISFSYKEKKFELDYEPGESQSSLFGGNSNWRGPIWFPINFLIIESLQKFHHYYGSDFKVECPTGSGTFLNLGQIAQELSRRICRIFLHDQQGRRALYGRNTKMQTDPHFRDHLLFFEYFHGDKGHGLGASHQTGWTGLVAKLLRPRQAEV